jgi:DNA polymerase III subunit epsilon
MPTPNVVASRPCPPVHARDWRLVAFDTETTGMGGSHRMIEIGAVRFQGGEPLDEFQALVDPGRPISSGARAVHGISDEDVRGCPPIGDVLPRFFDFVGDDPLVAHNAPFDAGVVAHEAARAGIVPPDNPIFDSCRWARRNVEAESYALQALVTALDLPRGRHHRALADAHHVVRLWQRCIETWEKQGDGTLLALLSRHGRPLRLEDYRPIPPPLPASVSALGPSLEAGCSVSLLYRSEGASWRRRVVTPRLIYAHGDRVYLEALCHESGLLKCYRLDRIRGVEPVEPPP